MAHLPAGYTYVRTGDFRLNPQHPPLIKGLAGVPLLLLDLAPVELTPGWLDADEWVFGRAFLTNNRAPMERILLLARLPMVGVGVLLGATLFLWARDLWGQGPALFALLLYALCPNVLGHTALVTTDVGVSCFTMVTLYALWRLVRGGKRRDAVVCGVALGLALLAKYTGVVTAGLVPVLVAGAWLLGRRASRSSRRPRSRRPQCGRERSVADARRRHPSPSRRRAFALTPRALLVSLGIIASLALLVVALGFGAPAGIANYLDGFSRIYADANPLWEGFLWGEYSSTGFRYYYLLASLWKTPLPTLIAFAIALASISLSTPARRVDWLFILAPFAAFHAAGVFNQANIGIRHVLPAYPFMFLACGAAAARLAARRRARQDRDRRALAPPRRRHVARPSRLPLLLQRARRRPGARHRLSRRLQRRVGTGLPPAGQSGWRSGGRRSSRCSPSSRCLPRPTACATAPSGSTT